MVEGAWPEGGEIGRSKQIPLVRVPEEQDEQADMDVQVVHPGEHSMHAGREEVSEK